MAASNTNDYVVLSGQKLDPKVFVDPHSGAPLPILVQSVGGGTDITTLENSATAIHAAIGANTDTYTPGLIRATAAGTVSAGMFEVSVANVGIANGTVLGATIKPDEIVTFRCASGGHKLAAVSYDGTGTELLITTLLRV